MKATRRELISGGLMAFVAACNGGTTTDTSGNTDTSGGTGGTCTTSTDGTIVTLCIADNPDLANVDGSITVNTRRGRLIVVRIDDTTVIADSDVCTHAGCPVQWRANHGDLYCACHASVFSPDGTVQSGPARSPLPSYPTTFDGETITIDVS